KLAKKEPKDKGDEPVVGFGPAWLLTRGIEKAGEWFAKRARETFDDLRSYLFPKVEPLPKEGWQQPNPETNAKPRPKEEPNQGRPSAKPGDGMNRADRWVSVVKAGMSQSMVAEVSQYEAGIRASNGDLGSDKVLIRATEQMIYQRRALWMSGEKLGQDMRFSSAKAMVLATHEKMIEWLEKSDLREPYVKMGLFGKKEAALFSMGDAERDLWKLQFKDYGLSKGMVQQVYFMIAMVGMCSGKKMSMGYRMDQAYGTCFEEIFEPAHFIGFLGFGTVVVGSGVGQQFTLAKFLEDQKIKAKLATTAKALPRLYTQRFVQAMMQFTGPIFLGAGMTIQSSVTSGIQLDQYREAQARELMPQYRRYYALDYMLHGLPMWLPGMLPPVLSMTAQEDTMRAKRNDIVADWPMKEDFDLLTTMDIAPPKQVFELSYLPHKRSYGSLPNLPEPNRSITAALLLSGGEPSDDIGYFVTHTKPRDLVAHVVMVMIAGELAGVLMPVPILHAAVMMEIAAGLGAIYYDLFEKWTSDDDIVAWQEEWMEKWHEHMAYEGSYPSGYLTVEWIQNHLEEKIEMMQRFQFLLEQEHAQMNAIVLAAFYNLYSFLAKDLQNVSYGQNLSGEYNPSWQGYSLNLEQWERRIRELWAILDAAIGDEESEALMICQRPSIKEGTQTDNIEKSLQAILCNTKGLDEMRHFGVRWLEEERLGVVPLDLAISRILENDYDRYAEVAEPYEAFLLEREEQAPEKNEALESQFEKTKAAMFEASKDSAIERIPLQLTLLTHTQWTEHVFGRLSENPRHRIRQMIGDSPETLMLTLYRLRFEQNQGTSGRRSSPVVSTGGQNSGGASMTRVDGGAEASGDQPTYSIVVSPKAENTLWTATTGCQEEDQVNDYVVTGYFEKSSKSGSTGMMMPHSVSRQIKPQMLECDEDTSTLWITLDPSLAKSITALSIAPINNPSASAPAFVRK
ncbi:MAG: hypothetical protein KDD48_07135, partial [Bdellovibrionales bacterium]|nr:hypothetical protein [Bdellovibrionales bacterium]